MKEAVPSQFALTLWKKMGKDGWKKKWLYPEGKEHVLRMKKWNQKLDQMYGEVPFLSNKCEIGEDCAYFEYLEQENLAEYLDDLDVS